MPGVLAVLTGEDAKADGLGNLICGWLVKSKDGSPMKAGPHPLLALDKVRYVGDPVAVIVAETYQQAKDAGEALEVDYERAGPGRVRRRRPRCRRAGPRRGRQQPDLRLGAGRQGGDRRRLRQCGPCHPDRPGQQPAGPQRDGAARRGRPLRQRQRQLHLLRHQPEPARAPAGHVGVHRRGARAQAARGGPRRRWRLRLEDLHLQRGMRRHLGVEEGRRPAGQVDRGPQRGVPHRRARPRPCQPRRARHSTRRATPWPCA